MQVFVGTNPKWEQNFRRYETETKWQSLSNQNFQCEKEKSINTNIIRVCPFIDINNLVWELP